VDGADMQAVYALRGWGLFALTAGRRAGVTGWAAQCSHEPPRMWVAASGADAEAIRAGGRFGLSLLAEDQLPLARDLARGAAAPADALQPSEAGVDVLRDAVAQFACEVEGELAGGVFYGPVAAFAWGRRDASQLRADQLAAIR
jgi:flavin reductase (DIM6/NTAB) family NADH-FMN oxidoreductase RutF